MDGVAINTFRVCGLSGLDTQLLFSFFVKLLKVCRRVYSSCFPGTYIYCIAVTAAAPSAERICPHLKLLEKQLDTRIHQNSLYLPLSFSSQVRIRLLICCSLQLSLSILFYCSSCDSFTPTVCVFKKRTFRPHTLQKIYFDNKITECMSNQVLQSTDYVCSSPSVHILCVFKPFRPHTICV